VPPGLARLMLELQQRRRYLLAPDYADGARAVVRAMQAQVGKLTVSEDGLALCGRAAPRHAGMPEDARAIPDWVAELSRDTYVNVMEQYHPAWKATTDPKYAAINRTAEPEEMEAAFLHARRGCSTGFAPRFRLASIVLAPRRPAWDGFAGTSYSTASVIRTR
jgi:uncharacterized Fe-S radical SAM superfamily protein PflX